LPRTTKTTAATSAKPARPSRRAKAGVQPEEQRDPHDSDGQEQEGAEAEESEGEAAAEREDELAEDPDAVTAEIVDEDEAPKSVPDPDLQEAGPIERFDALQTYLREVQRHPLLTPEKTHELAVKFIETQDPALARVLVTANLRLVVKIAYEYRRAYKNIMDLIQEGNIGLMQAVKRYDPYRGVKLSSYAAWWIRAYILRFILNNWRLVKLGTTQAQRKLFFNLRKKRAELTAMGVELLDGVGTTSWRILV
jgi:RNA polymerase sigma-32 factor